MALRYAFILCLLVMPELHAQSGDNSILSMERIFMKPYIAGSRPINQKISPDGKTIIYQWDEKRENKYRYWMMNADGSNQHIINDTLLNDIEWSPDSKAVACVRKGDIFLTDTSFKSFERITKTDAYEGGIHWSQDGKLLSFSSDGKLIACHLGSTGFYEVSRSGQKDASVSFIEFSPDNKHITFFESNRDSLQEFIVPRYTGKEVSTSSFKGGVSKIKIGIAPVDTGETVWLKFSRK